MSQEKGSGLTAIDAKNKVDNHMSGKDKKTFVILFHASFCGHCTEFMPAFDAACQKVNSSEIYKMNEEEALNKIGQALMREVSAPGFPTLVKFKNGKKVMYTGDRSVKSVEAFLKE